MSSLYCSAALGLVAPNVLSQQLTEQLPLFPSIQWVEHTDSTNTDLLHLARSKSGQLMRPWLLGAHFQNHGRGRAGRVWQNKTGSHLMFSCAFDVFLPSRQLATLSPIAGIAVAEALRSFLPVHKAPFLTLKWPNDIQWHQAKLAGILTEVTRASTSSLSKDHHVVIIGVGINLNDARALSTALDRQIADWSEIVADIPSLTEVTAACITSRIAQAWYQTLNEVTAFGFDKINIIKRYNQIDALKNQYLTVTHQDKVILSGISAGINHQGELLVRQGEQTHTVTVGDISVRPFKSAATL